MILLDEEVHIEFITDTIQKLHQLYAKSRSDCISHGSSI